MTVNPYPSTGAIKSGRITCHYVNKTTKLQVVRISNIPGYFFERVVFASQQLLIDVDSEAVLEISSHELASSIVSDCIPCCQLRYAEPLSLPKSSHHPTSHHPTNQHSTDGQTNDKASGQKVA